MNGGLSLLTGHGSIGGKMGSVLFFCSERGGIGQVELTHQKQRKQRERCAGWCCLFLLARPFFYFFLNSSPPSLSCIFVSFIHIYIFQKFFPLPFSIFNFPFGDIPHGDKDHWPKSCPSIMPTLWGICCPRGRRGYNWHSKLRRGWFCHCGYSAFPLIGTRARVALQRSKSVTVVPQRGPNPSPLQFLFLTLHPFGAFLRLSGLTQKQGSEWFWLLRACTWHTHLPSFHSLQDSSQVLFSTVGFFHAFRDEFSSILFPSS